MPASAAQQPQHLPLIFFYSPIHILRIIIYHTPYHHISYSVSSYPLLRITGKTALRAREKALADREARVLSSQREAPTNSLNDDTSVSALAWARREASSQMEIDTLKATVFKMQVIPLTR